MECLRTPYGLRLINQMLVRINLGFDVFPREILPKVKKIRKKLFVPLERLHFCAARNTKFKRSFKK